MNSFIKKLLICLSQMIWGLPGSALTYYVADYVERKKIFDDGYDLQKLFFILAVWVVFCGLFIPVWIIFIKKTGISSTKEYKELQDSMKR